MADKLITWDTPSLVIKEIERARRKAFKKAVEEIIKKEKAKKRK